MLFFKQLSLNPKQLRQINKNDGSVEIETLEN